MNRAVFAAANVLRRQRPDALIRAFATAKPCVKVTFVKPSGEKVTVDAPTGDSMLEVAHANNIDIEGACGGETACSTCHVILAKEVFDALPEMTEAEEDMLDLAAGLKPTSRLGCQVIAAAALNGAEITMPKEVNNMLGKDE